LSDQRFKTLGQLKKNQRFKTLITRKVRTSRNQELGFPRTPKISKYHSQLDWSFEIKIRRFQIKSGKLDS